MLNLSLIRHARSSLDNSIHDDMSRPISLQGIDKTKKVCEFLKKKKISFDEVFCSPSKRTKETLYIIEKYLPNKSLVNYLDNLYHTSTTDIFDTVMLEAKKKVLIVSHQPLLSNSINSFFIGSKNKYYYDAITSYNTSALFNVSFNCEKWQQILKSNAVLNFFVKPSEL